MKCHCMTNHLFSILIYTLQALYDLFESRSSYKGQLLFVNKAGRDK